MIDYITESYNTISNEKMVEAFYPKFKPGHNSEFQYRKILKWIL